MLLLSLFLRRWWWLIALPPLVALVYTLATWQPAAGGYSLAMRYTAADSTPAVAEQGVDSTYNSFLSSEYIVAAMKDWVRTGEFAQAVSAELAQTGLSLDAATVAGRIQASDNARSILIVYLGGPDAAELVGVADAVTRVLQARNAAVFPQLNGDNAAVTALDMPSPGLAAAPLRAQLEPLLRIALALAGGLALALLAWYFDPVIRTRHELERQGWRVLGAIRN
jgi:capsular polysaccharide biosynthesis protein